jgi:hypothetical protein
MRQVLREMPAQAGRIGVAGGEAAREPVSDEACCPRCETEDTGSGLLQAALTRENLQRAFKRVRANKGAAGVDGLDIDQTAQWLATAWPGIREQLLAGTYRPSPVRRVPIAKPDGGERELGIPTVIITINTISHRLGLREALSLRCPVTRAHNFAPRWMRSVAGKVRCAMAQRAGSAKSARFWRVPSKGVAGSAHPWSRRRACRARCQRACRPEPPSRTMSCWSETSDRPERRRSGWPSGP